MLTITNLQELIEELQHLYSTSTSTNAHTREHGLFFKDFDVVVYGVQNTILVYRREDTDRMNPFLRFERVNFKSMKFLQVSLAIWKYCNADISEEE